MKCPHCGSDRVVRYGKDEFARQRWLCKNETCGRRFTADEDKGVDEKNPAEFAEENAKSRRLGQENQGLKSRIRQLEDALYMRAETEKGLESALKLRHEPFVLPAHEYQNDATVMLNLSDLHVGCVVEPDRVLGINEYNKHIAKARLIRLFSETVAFGRFMKCGRLVINLLGDMVHGEIHKSALDLNAPDAIIYLYDLLMECIRGAAEWFSEISLECVVGNHGRTGVKMESVAVALDSYEHILYEFLRRGLEPSGVCVNVPDAQYLLSEYSGVRVLILHGHSIKGGNGMVDFPAMGVVRNSNRMQGMFRNIGADFDLAIMGHFHTFVNIPDNMNRRVIINPSLIGADEYAINALAKAYPPAQTVMLLNAGNLEIVKEIRL